MLKSGPRLSHPRVLILCSEDPDDLLAMQVIFCLRCAGACVHLLSDGKEIAYKYSRHCQKFTAAPFPVEHKEAGAFLDVLNGYIQRENIDVVLATDIESTRLLATIAPGVKGAAVFPISDLPTIALLDDKWRFYQLLQDLNLQTPQTVYVESLTPEAIEQIRSLTFPVMVKPLSLSGSRGIARLDTVEDVEAHIRGGGLFTALPLVVQTYIPGRDLGLSMLAIDGRLVAHAVMIKTESAQYGETVEYVNMPEVVAFGERLMSGTRYTGIAHIDLRLNDETGEFSALECNPRFWFTVSKAMCFGLNFAALGVQFALNTVPERIAPITPGTFYVVQALRARRMYLPSRFRQVSFENLLLIWMERSDIALTLYRKLRRRRMRREVAQGTASVAAQWRVQRDRSFASSGNSIASVQTEPLNEAGRLYRRR